MNRFTVPIQCPLPGFDGVRVVFDLAASPEQIKSFIRLAGSEGSHEIVKVEGWPVDLYGPDPWDGARVPSIWLSWISMFAQKGYEMALRPPEANAKNDKTSRNGHSCKPSSL